MSDYLLPEVVTEILKRLPVKSLLRFRCVCKKWCSLISSPNFISQHLSLSSSDVHSPTLVRHFSKLFNKEIYTLYYDHSFNPENSSRIAFPFHQKSKYYRIVGYCNGILCFSDDLFGCRESIILWNPSIKRAITLPTPRVVFDRCGPYMFALGFGFDSKNNDFKVVRVCYLLPDDRIVVPPKVEVYSVSLGRWRRVKTSTEAYITERFWSQAVRDGVVHWNAFHMPTTSVEGRNLVLKFDLGSEEFGELGLPEDLVGVPPISILVVLIKGSLSVVVYDEYMTNFKMDFTTSCTIWVMKEYGNVESWAKLYKINLNGGLGMVLGMRRCGDIVLSTESGELVSYDCENKRVSSTGISGTKCSSFVDEYVESLMLMGKGEVVRGVEPEEDHEVEDEKVENEEHMRRSVIMMHMVSFIMGR